MLQQTFAQRLGIRVAVGGPLIGLGGLRTSVGSFGIGLRLSGFSLGACGGGSIGLGLGLCRLQLGLLSLILRVDLGLLSLSLTLISLLAQGHDAGILGALHRLTRVGELHLHVAMLGGLNILSVLDVLSHLFHDVRGILIGARRLRDALRVVGLKQRERSVLAVADGMRD